MDYPMGGLPGAAVTLAALLAAAAWRSTRYRGRSAAAKEAGEHATREPRLLPAAKAPPPVGSDGKKLSASALWHALTENGYCNGSVRADKIRLLESALRHELREGSARVESEDPRALREAVGVARQACSRFRFALPELQGASRLLREATRRRRAESWKVVREVLAGAPAWWLAAGVAGKVLSQIPGPLRTPYLADAVAAVAGEDADLNTFKRSLIICGWLLALEKVLMFAGRYTMGQAECLFSARLRQKVFGSILTQDSTFFDIRKSGELQNRLGQDTKEVCDKCIYLPVRILQFTVHQLFHIAVMFSQSPQVALATVATLPFISWGHVVALERTQLLHQQVKKRMDEASAQTAQVLANMQLVRAFDCESWELHRFQGHQDYQAKLQNRVSTWFSVVGPVFTFMAEAYIFAGLYVSVGWFGRGGLGVREFVTLLQSSQQTVGMTVNELVRLLPELSQLVEPSLSVLDMLNRRPTPPEPSCKRMRGHIEFDAVTFHYPNRPALVFNGLTFELRPGDMLGLVGTTGAGKSTIIRLLLRFYDASDGEIRVDGQAITSLNPRWLRRRIGIVVQQPVLFACTIRENLLYGTHAHDLHDAEVRRACDLANVSEFLDRLPQGLCTEVGERGVQLSGGQMQRLCVARVVLKKPDALVLDEATSNLDAESEASVLRAFVRAAHSQRCSSIIISHRIATVESATKIVVLKDGAAAECGTFAELRAQPGGYLTKMMSF